MDIEAAYDKIYRYLYYKLKNKETAEDITQQSFLKFWEHSEYRSNEAAIKILYTIAGNLLINEYRRKRADESIDEGEFTDVSEESFENEVISKNIVACAVNKLDPVTREIVFLRVENDEKVSVIADMLGISRFAVRRKFKHAMERLRKEKECTDFLEQMVRERPRFLE